MKRAIAMIVLGFCLSGIVLAADPVLPKDILRDARGGDPEAQVEMGILYEYGFRMKGNRIAALAWYLLAADEGNTRATRYSDKLIREMRPSAVDAARKKSRALTGR